MMSDSTIYLLTWNINAADPCKDLANLLSLQSSHSLPNMYVIGLQELKSSGVTWLVDAVFDDPWTNALTQCLAARDYVRVSSLRMLATHLAVFVRRPDLPFISDLQTTYTRTGFAGYFGSKGAVTLRMDVCGVSLCFVNGHFRAHHKNYIGRLKDYRRVVESQKFEINSCKTILDHDYVFWFGDLNFRMDELSTTEVKSIVAAGDIESLWKYDQLKRAIQEGLLLLDYEEGPLNFRPTFKYDVGCQEYDTSPKNRVPSWCDRVLWHVHKDAYPDVELKVDLEQYTSLDEFVDSDHKPVIALCSLLVFSKDVVRPKVTFAELSSWSHLRDCIVSYVVAEDFPVTSRDWIGFYKCDYRHWYDYLTYVWASSKPVDNVYTVTFSASYLHSIVPGRYCLLYFSASKQSVITYSEELTVVRRIPAQTFLVQPAKVDNCPCT